MTDPTPVDGGDARMEGEHPDARPTSGTGTRTIDDRMLQIAPVAIFGLEPSGRVCLWNDAAERLFGWAADEVLGDVAPFIDHRSGSASEQAARMLRGETVIDLELSLPHRDGHELDLVMSSSTVSDRAGQPTAVLSFVCDASEGRAMRADIAAIEHKWRTLAWRTTDAITIADAAGRVLETVVGAEAMLGYPSDWWMGKVATEVIHPDDIARASELWATLVENPDERARMTFRARHFDGHYEQVEFTGTNMIDDPQVGGIVITNRSVSPTRQAEALLADEARIFELIARDASLDRVVHEIARMIEYHTGGSAAILVVDAADHAIAVAASGSVPHPVIERLTHDLRVEEPLEPSRRRQPTDDPRSALGTDVIDIVEDPRTAGSAGLLADHDLRTGWITPIVDRRMGVLAGFVVTLIADARTPTSHERKVADLARDLAAIAIGRDRWQRDLRELALLDDLTGLPNRSLIFQTLESAMARSWRDRGAVTVMVLDLDRFKYVNDSLGHVAGDALIALVADRLRSILRTTDLVGRMSADEFVVIFGDDAGLVEAQRAATRFRDVLDEPFLLSDVIGAEQVEVFLTASVGIATSTAGREGADVLLQHADHAMFRAKELGRDQVVVYDEGLRNRALDRLALDRDLRVALERDQFVLHFQPEISCSTGAIIGAEALVRWEHPDRGLIQPDGFIGLAEETGVIVPIGHWVLDEALRQARTWLDAGVVDETFSMSVNLSARQLINRSVVDTVAFVLTRYDWPPSHLTLELTESILIEDRDATLYVLDRLRMLGVRLAIDDFGTGFAALEYLHRLHVDTVKIDRSFVTPIAADGLRSPVATAMVHMAKAFDLVVTAEGVENERQFSGMRALGCDSVQGYLFSRPVPASAFESLLAGDHRW